MEKEVNFVVELSSGIPAAPGTGIFLDNPSLTISGLSAIVAGLFVASLLFRKLLSRAVTTRSVHRNYRRLTLITIVFLACFSLSGIHFFRSFHVFAASHIKHTTDGKTIIEADILGTDHIAIVKDSIKIPEATKWGYQLYFYYQDSGPVTWKIDTQHRC